MSPIVLLTDFGLSDPYVGIMKGVILSRCPQARIVDLCHGIPPQDVRAGGFCLMTALPYFPEGTLFVCVVDPGVGSKRRVLWARSSRHRFLAPDNGLLGWAARVEPLREVRSVTNQGLFLERVSRTFHGRDVFAPVAAALANGLPADRLGPRCARWKSPPFPKPLRAGARVRGQVLAIDHFGNAITNLRAEHVGRVRSFRAAQARLGPLRDHYAQVRPGEPLALLGSSGFVEFSLRNGNFARSYRVTVGEAVYGE